MKKTLMILTIALTIAACTKKQVPQATSTQPPPLPADVQAVATVATNGAPASAGTAPAEAGAPSAPAAEIAGGKIAATGEFVSPVRSELSARITGRVGKIYVDEGSRVTKGQPILEIETQYVRLNLQKAEADSARAKAMLDDTKRDLERKKGLMATNSIPQATFDRSLTAFDQANAAYASAQAQVALLRQQLEDSVVRSPIDGVVAAKRTDVGQRLSDNTVAVVVAQTSPLKLRFRVPERYLSSVHKGQSVKANVDPYPGQVFEGRVTVIGGVIDPATRSLLVETEFPNRDGKLRPGMFARVELEPAG
ncbi:MAG TPA: efflux RND transporter periplasmic adaptor subunit [Thermoanaerobaculia bacterium]|nr:efflux RND transporter periplasmic adaptor subunit [Thermoanaerobaculia bacterium]